MSKADADPRVDTLLKAVEPFFITMKQNLQNSQKSANYPYLVQKG